MKSEDKLSNHQSYISEKEYTETEYDHCFNPSSTNMLNLFIMIPQIITHIWRYLKKESSDISTFQYHKKHHNSNQSPISYKSPNRTHNGNASSSKNRDLIGEKSLNTSCILLNNIKSMSDIFFAKKK